MIRTAHDSNTPRASHRQSVPAKRKGPRSAFVFASLLAFWFLSLAPQAAAQDLLTCPGPRDGDKDVLYNGRLWKPYGLGCLNVSVSAASTLEGDDGAKVYSFEVRSAISPGLKYIPHGEYFLYEVQLGGTATEGEDYELWWRGNRNALGVTGLRPQRFWGQLYDSSLSAGGPGVAETFYFRVLGDEALEPDETITFAINYRAPNPSTGEAEYQIAPGKNTATFTIRNDDAAAAPDKPTVTVTPDKPGIREGEPATYTVSRTGATTAALTVQLSVSEKKQPETNTPQRLFVASSNKGDKTVAIPSGQSSVSYSVPTTAYATADWSSLVGVELRSDPAYVKGNPSFAGVTVASDHRIAVAVTVTPGISPVMEGDPATFTVSRAEATTAALTVRLAVSEDETGGRDFVAAGDQGYKTVAIPANQRSATYSVPTVGDGADEPNGAVTVTLGADRSYNNGDPSSATVIVNDDDGPPPATPNDDGGLPPATPNDGGDPPPATPMVSIAADGGAITEGASATFTVTADAAPTANLTVSLTVSENTSSGRDFVASSDEGNKTVTIQANASSATYSVATVNDSADEPNGSVTVTVATGSGYTVGANSSASVTVNDNDDSGGGGGGTPDPANPVVSFASSSLSAAEDAGSVDVAVNLSPAPTSGITVSYTVGGTAASGADFSALSGSVSVASGATSVNIAVAITDDSADESNETVILTLTAGSGYAVGSTSAHTLTITDNDSGGGGGTSTPSPPANSKVSFESTSSSAAEDAGSMNIAVNLSPAPASAITVNYTTGGTAASGTDFAALSGSVSVASGATSVNIPVAITDDSADESDETVILTLTAGSGYAVGSASAHTLTITDNDDPATSAEDSEIPEAFALRQNYPNPFNPSTTIEFSLNKAQHVSLAVYDLLGQEVRVLMDGVQPAANHRVSFDASDLPSGAYLYVLRAEEETAVKKMSLLR